MSIIRLPGLIDVHVHLRDPGQTHKEDFFTGTSSALAGGFTTVLDMPNNIVPITTQERLEEKIQSAKNQTVCDIGFYFGSLGDTIEEFQKIKDTVFGLKLYLNITTGGFIITPEKLNSIFQSWTSSQPILCHAEEDMIDMIVEIVRKIRKPVHICHTSSKNELQKIIKAKNEELPITCGVCPHHLFLNETIAQHLEGYGKMKPPLHTQKDTEFLWNNLQYIDVIESDHAPHTKEEKNSENPPFGVPGLETTLPLLLHAEKEGKLSRNKIISLCYQRPMEIFHIPQQPDTFVEIEDREFIISDDHLFTKCQWTPFKGMKARGIIKKVTIRGKTVFENGNILINRGEGIVIYPET
ncbi:MAG: amidohydrolase family protein [Candidatus Roizmanbacteria bacterium]